MKKIFIIAIILLWSSVAWCCSSTLSGTGSTGFVISGPTSETIVPDSGADAANWSCSEGAWNVHIAALGDSDNSTYIYTSSSNTIESYHFSDTSDSSSISSVTFKVTAKGIANDTLRYFLYIGGYYYAPDITLTTTMTEYSNTWATNPATGAAWTKSEVDALDAAVRSGTITGEIDVAEMHIEVAH